MPIVAIYRVARRPRAGEAVAASASVGGCRLLVARGGKVGASFDTADGAPTLVQLPSDGEYEIRETVTADGRRRARSCRLTVAGGHAMPSQSRGGEARPADVRPASEAAGCPDGVDAAIVIADGGLRQAVVIPAAVAGCVAVAAVVATLATGTRNPADAFILMADQAGITHNNERARMTVSGSITFASVADVTWVAQAGEQPIVIQNPASSTSTVKYFDISPDDDGFDVSWESLEPGRAVTARVSLLGQGTDGRAMEDTPVTVEGGSAEYEWELTPDEERGSATCPLPDGISLPDGAEAVCAVVTIPERQSVDICPRLFLDYDGSAKGKSGQELLDDLMAGYDEECVYDPVTYDDDGNVTGYEGLIAPGNEITSVTLDEAPRTGEWDLYVYYTTLDVEDHHECNPGLLGGTTVTVIDTTQATGEQG